MLLSLIVSFLISYFILESIFLSLLFSILSLLLMFSINKLTKEKTKTSNRYDNICDFIDMMNSQMINSSDLFDSYQKIENYLSIDFINISKEDMIQQLNEIASDYNSAGFKMYVTDMKIYNEYEVDYLSLVNNSTKLAYKERNVYIKFNIEKYNCLKQINYLYVLWIALISFIKVFVSDYYSLMLSNLIYKILFFIILVIGLLSYYFSYKEYLK